MPCHLHGTIPDTVNGVRAAFDLASEGPAEMILSIGGVSNGRHDLVRLALEQMGAEILFHGLAMRPGKPLLFALLPDGRPFFGLPGNPLAALVGFRFFVAAAARRLMGSAPELGSPLAEPPPGREGITLFLRGRRTPSGVVPLENQRSHMMSSLINADCWIRADLAEGNARAVVFPLYDGLG
jgi:molybdopterin molybdotransferase